MTGMLLQFRRPLQSRLMGERKTGTGGKGVEICHIFPTRFIPRVPVALRDRLLRESRRNFNQLGGDTAAGNAANLVLASGLEPPTY